MWSVQHAGANMISNSSRRVKVFYKDTITGKVADLKGKPLQGVTVRIKGTQTTVTTNDAGEFSIPADNTNVVLVFSHVGFDSLELPASKAKFVQLTANDNALDEVVVVGFGTQKKVNLTGAISHVGKDVFENRPVANIGQALQGLVPNLNITFNNGAPNTTPGFNLRGGTSFKKENENSQFEAVNGNPLIIIDGVEGSSSQLNQLNPNDILDMSFVKDASAAAIYGTKGAFGVILVRTRRGEFNQKGKIAYSYDLSLDKPAAIPDILDAAMIQRASMDKTLWTGGSVGTSDERKLDMINKYIQNPIPENAWYEEANRLIWVANTNPFKEMVRDWTPMQKHTLNASGGAEAINYYVSLGYQDQQGMYKINTDKFKRYNTLVNLNAKVKDRFNIFVKIGFDQTDYERPYLVGGKGNIWQAMTGDPGRNINMPIKTGPNDPLPNTYTDNILAWTSYGARNRSRERKISLVASPEFIILPNKLKLKADIAYLPQNNRLNRYSPKMQQIVDSWNYTVQQQEAAENRAYLEHSYIDNYVMNLYADYQQTWGKDHQFSTVLGYNQEKTDYGLTGNELRKLLSPNVPNPDASEDASLHLVETAANTITGRAAFGRVNYIYKGKYLFESNYRYDGSSKFTPKDRFVSFPSFSIGWRISDERFMAATSSWLNNLKIRASWGKLGNQPSNPYPYQPVLLTGQSTYLIDGNRVTYLSPPKLVSPYLTFEKAETKNIGLDATFLSNRLDLTFELYRRTTKDILTDGNANYTSFLGTDPPYVNSGIFRTDGFELALQWKDKLENGLHYRVGFNLSDYSAKVNRFAGNDLKTLKKGNDELLYNGKEIGEIWGYETGGILQETDFAGRNPNGSWIFNGPYQSKINANLYPGYIWYQDLNGDGKVDNGNGLADDSGDMRVIGNSTPRYKFGLTGNVQYKGFDLDFLFQGVLKRDVWTSSSSYWGGGAGSRWMLERSWTPTNTDAKFPMYTAPIQTQSGYLINGAYIRLKQLVLGYTLPKEMIKKIGLERARFTLSGFNIFEITQIPGVFDPDQISSQYPQKRTVAIGTQIVF
ncbi:hypothetical protein BWD42_07635 [Sphingobacterium sp. CZ-UAM]|nr:hypothetical protein BWD42_07635 [Sphingobacterium sp. CZ-UAM]